MTKQPGTIVTFYSYKGGVGRSMALANVAYILATYPSFGQPKVLMIDWDLEAPGLYRFFQDCFRERIKRRTKEAYREELPKASGLMEYIGRAAEIYRSASPDGGLDEARAELPEAAKIYDEVRHDRDYDFDGLLLPFDEESNLMLLKAGSEGDDYSDRVRAFNWDEFYVKYGSFFTHFRRHLMTEYDYILIDSRTGLTDTGGICTRVMPEKMVGVFAPNFQNIEGLTKVIRRSAEYRRNARDPRTLVVFPLASRIAAGAEKLRKIWWRGGELGDDQYFDGYQKTFENLFTELYDLDNCDLSDYFDATQIPHDNDYAFGEKVAARLDHGRSADKLSIGTACENLTDRLVGLDAPWELLPELAKLSEAQRQAEVATQRVTTLETRQKWSQRLVFAIAITIVLAMLASSTRVRSFLSRFFSKPTPAGNISSTNLNAAQQSSRTPTPYANAPLKIVTSASSVRLAVSTNTYVAENAIDDKRSTAWIEGADGPGLGEWIRFDFDREIMLHRILIMPGYFKDRQTWAQNNRIAEMTAEFSDGSSRLLTFSDRMETQKIDLGSVKTRWVRLVIKSVFYGTDPDTAISEVAFEWEP